MQSPLAQQETIAESKRAPVPHAFAAGGLGLYDQRIGPLSCSGITAPGASSVLTIAAKGGEAIMKPKKKSRPFQLPALPKAPWWLSLTIASVSLMVSVIALTR